ncbi:hypothetical protein M8C21_025114 [Ambrosia artemisiifolia]|uniref:Protein groES n=1 Tax=Ambrosia artemisiifolia TaxID=4212 RepID=A0AAD5DEG5_AMBAR|nr:hypothetical protein M8C21_025114 [Ambrosia artemisiifolia]
MCLRRTKRSEIDSVPYSAMAKRLIPCLNRVLVEKIVPPSKTTAGILLPEKSSKLNSGKVIAVGPGTRDKSGNNIPVAVKEGDTVLLPEYGGTEVKLGEKEYVFLFCIICSGMRTFWELCMTSYSQTEIFSMSGCSNVMFEMLD